MMYGGGGDEGGGEGGATLTAAASSRQYHLRPRVVSTTGTQDRRMATYAAYRHIELYNVGHGKKRVLKPPGGGSSDIFGSTHDPEPQQRKVKNHLTSSIFGGEDSQTPARKAEVTTNGEKAETAVNGSSSASSTASTPASAPTAAAAPAASATAPAASRPQRVPPGGFSSGLW